MCARGGLSNRGELATKQESVEQPDRCEGRLCNRGYTRTGVERLWFAVGERGRTNAEDEESEVVGLCGL